MISTYCLAFGGGLARVSVSQRLLCLLLRAGSLAFWLAGQLIGWQVGTEDSYISAVPAQFRWGGCWVILVHLGFTKGYYAGRVCARLWVGPTTAAILAERRRRMRISLAVGGRSAPLLDGLRASFASSAWAYYARAFVGSSALGCVWPHFWDGEVKAPASLGQRVKRVELSTPPLSAASVMAAARFCC